MTKEAVSGELFIYQMGNRFSSDVTLGWTSARSPRALGMMISRSRGPNRKFSDFVLALKLRPSVAYSDPQMRDVSSEHVAHYSVDDDHFAHLSLHGDSGRVVVTTSASESIGILDPPLCRTIRLKLFIAIPVSFRDYHGLPEAQLLQHIEYAPT